MGATWTGCEFQFAAGERKDRVGELLIADESTREQQQQQEQLHAAAAELWQFAAAHLSPQQVQLLQQAAVSPRAGELLQRDTELLAAVQQLRDAEMQRLLLQLPEKQRKEAAADKDLQQRLLAEHSHLLRIVRDACAA